MTRRDTDFQKTPGQEKHAKVTWYVAMRPGKRRALSNRWMVRGQLLPAKG